MTFWNVATKAQIERKRIYKTANAVGGAFLMGYVLSIFLQTAFGSVVKDASIINDPCTLWLLQIFLSTIIFTIPFIVLTVPMNVRVSSACPLGRGEKGTFLPIILVGLGASMLGNILSSMFTGFLETIGFSSYNPPLPTDTSSGWHIPLLVMLGGVILPALIEEFALRGIALGALKKFGNTFAIILTAVLFGLMHGNIEQIPFAFVLGLYLGFAVIRTGTMWTAVVIHLINNGFAFLIQILQGVVGNAELNVISYIYFMLTVLLTAVGLLLGSRVKGCFSLPKEEKGELTLGEKLSTAALTPCIIIFALYEFLLLALTQIASMVTV